MNAPLRNEYEIDVEDVEYLRHGDQALLAHATQIDPDGAWFACPLEVHEKAWPTEDYELVRSFVDSSVPEDDLFAGVREALETMKA